MRKISLLTLILVMEISSLTYADNFYTDIRYANTGATPEYQIESAKKDVIFDENYTDYENRKDRKQKRERIENFYFFFSENFGLNIPNWKKLSDLDKISSLLDFLNKMSKENREKLDKMQFLTDKDTRDFYLNKYQDEFEEKVAGLDGKTEETFVTDYTGNKIPLTRITYVGENGKKYTKDVYHYENNDLVELKENNQSFMDYYDIDQIDGKYYVFSHGFSTDGNGTNKSSGLGAALPKGYTVARDRSEHLSDEEKGKLIVIPEDKSLLPDGVKIIDDGRGGKIVKAPESAYKPNGNLALKTDKTLQKTIIIGDVKDIDSDKFYEQTMVYEVMTQEGNISKTYGRERILSGDNNLYYSYATIDKNGDKSNFQEEGYKITDWKNEKGFDKNSHIYDEESEKYISTEEFAKKVSANKKSKNSYGE